MARPRQRERKGACRRVNSASRLLEPLEERGIRRLPLYSASCLVVAAVGTIRQAVDQWVVEDCDVFVIASQPDKNCHSMEHQDRPGLYVVLQGAQIHPQNHHYLDHH